MLRPYRAILARPGAPSFSAAAALARLPMSMVGIAIVLVVSSLYDSYGLAGRVSAVYVVATAVAAPQLGKLVDRFGQGRVMPPFVVLSVVGMAVLAVAAATKAPEPWLYVGAALSGWACAFGSMVRARWTHTLRDEPRLVHTAFSFESVIDELVFVVGPVVATFLATGPQPAVALALPALALLGGGLWLSAQRGTEPPVAGRDEPRPGGSVLRRPGMAMLLVVFVGMGSIFGSTDVATVAFAEEQGSKGSAGVVLAIFALGSLLAGLAYGARHWQSPLAVRFAVTIVLLALGACLFLVVGSLPALAGVMFVVGFTISPSIVSGNALVQALVPPERLTEGLAWVGTALSVGVSVGSAVAGDRVDAMGAHGGFLVVVVAAGAVVVAMLLAYRGLRAVGSSAVPDELDLPADVAG